MPAAWQGGSAAGEGNLRTFQVPGTGFFRNVECRLHGAASWRCFPESDGGIWDAGRTSEEGGMGELFGLLDLTFTTLLVARGIIDPEHTT